MAIEEIDIELPTSMSIHTLPEPVAAVIQKSDRRWELFCGIQGNRRLPRFVPSEADLVFAALDFVTRQGLPPGRVFCEWGSGFGTGTCLAALLGYEAYGIEIEPELVDIARQMAHDFDIAAEFLCTSYIPEGFESYAGVGGEELVKSRTFTYPGEALDAEPHYDGMAFDIAAIDLFFAYPWPEEQELMQQLFDAVAMEGAILIAYHSAKEICIYRKRFDSRGRC
jgi:SAM-dependent methyltransferase